MTMKPYLVEGGVMQFGPGEILGLSVDQYRRRRHNLRNKDGSTIDRKQPIEQLQKHGEIIVCVADAVLDFKVGETVLLPAAPPKSLADRLIPVDHDDGVKRPEKAEGRGGAERKAKAKGKSPTAAKAAAAGTGESAPTSGEQRDILQE